MKRAFLGAISVLVVLVGVGRAQAPQMPKPGPEHQRLAYFVGAWNSEMELKPGPMGPGGKMTSVSHYEMMPGGFFLISHASTKSTMGELKEAAFYGYDANEKMYTYSAFNSLGEEEHFKGTVQGDTWTWTNSQMMAGKMIKQRFTLKEVSPTSYSFKFDFQSEGGSWMNVMEGKAAKVTAAKPKAAETK